VAAPTTTTLISFGDERPAAVAAAARSGEARCAEGPRQSIAAASAIGSPCSAAARRSCVVRDLALVKQVIAQRASSECPILYSIVEIYKSVRIPASFAMKLLLYMIVFRVDLLRFLGLSKRK